MSTRDYRIMVVMIHQMRTRLVPALLVLGITGSLSAFTIEATFPLTPPASNPVLIAPPGIETPLDTPAIMASGEWSYEAPPVSVVAPVHVISRVSHASGVMSIALRYRGVPYVYGGKTPRGFDCSGFTKWVYARVGIRLPDSAAGQARAGRVVSRAQARPGDLVVWPGHVEIYAGNGMRIGANRPGGSVQVRPLYGSPRFVRVLP